MIFGDGEAAFRQIIGRIGGTVGADMVDAEHGVSEMVVIGFAPFESGQIDWRDLVIRPAEGHGGDGHGGKFFEMDMSGISILTRDSQLDLHIRAAFGILLIMVERHAAGRRRLLERLGGEFREELLPKQSFIFVAVDMISEAGDLTGRQIFDRNRIGHGKFIPF